MPVAARRVVADVLPAASATDAPPLTEAEFDACMARFAPFERAPALAFAVSGGRDSLCLALLASRWATRRGGRVIAVTVDHGLRPEAVAEARQVGDWLETRHIAHRTLRWTGRYPATGLQAAARRARYRLLTDFCRDQAIVHLLVAHHREDQGETVLIRRERASGRDGLAGMAAVVEQRHVRLLRPLLATPRERITATLAAADQPWIDDPSNADPRMARGRLRAQPNDSALRAAIAASQADAAARRAGETAAAELAARAVRFHPAGYVSIDRGMLGTASPDIAARLMAHTVMAVAGRSYPPRSDRTRRLVAALGAAGALRGRTLGGCRIIAAENLLYVCREPARAGPSVPVIAGAEAIWDNRFRLAVTKNLGADLRLGALTAPGWRHVVARDPRLRATRLPYAVRLALPALWRAGAVAMVPHLGFVADGEPAKTADLRLIWRPPAALAPARFGKV